MLTLMASTRPRYGGTLRVQVAELPAFETAGLVAETLVRIDGRGDYQPGLARAWQRDAEGRRWRFSLRPRVVMHDGTLLTPAVAAVLLGPSASVAGQQVVIQSDTPAPDMLERVASKVTIVRKAADGSLTGTGPFRLTKLEPGRRATLTAFEEHWAGRPFLDSLEFTTQRGGPVDVTALPVSTSRRAIGERVRVWTSPPRDLAILSRPAALRDVFALSIDRDAIANVITQKRGDPARGLLPDWLTGYSAALPSEHDLTRARQAAAAAKAGPVTIAVAPSDPLLRLIADRIALNVRDAGLSVTVGNAGTVRLVRLRLPSNNAAQALAEFARALGVAVPTGLTNIQALYDAERAMLTENGIVPVVHLPDVYAVDPRVHNFDPARLEMVWVE